MNVLILAAGEGTRLRPYTLDYPKCMVEIDGESLIDRQLSILNHVGIKDIVLIGGYKIEMLEGKGDRLVENPRYFETNMVRTLFCAEDELNGEVVVSYGDIVYSHEILDSLLASHADISVVIDKDWETYWRARIDNPLDDAETLKLAGDGSIIELGQKPKSVQEIEGQYIGLMKFSPKGVEQIKSVFSEATKSGTLLNKPVDDAYLTDLLQAAIDSGIKVTSVVVNGGWVEVDTVEDLKSPITAERLRMIEAR